MKKAVSLAIMVCLYGVKKQLSHKIHASSRSPPRRLKQTKAAFLPVPTHQKRLYAHPIRPFPNHKLTIRHIRQLPILSPKHTIPIPPPHASPATNSAAKKWSSLPCASLYHGCSISAATAFLCSPPQSRDFRKRILDLLAEIEDPGLRRREGWAKLSR